MTLSKSEVRRRKLQSARDKKRHRCEQKERDRERRRRQCLPERARHHIQLVGSPNQSSCTHSRYHRCGGSPSVVTEATLDFALDTSKTSETHKTHQALKRSKRPTAADKVFSVPELLEIILWNLTQRRDLLRAQLTCRSFSNAVTSSSRIQTRITGVLSSKDAPGAYLAFRGERISDFLRLPRVLSLSRFTYEDQLGCIHGFGGEDFIERDDAAYSPMDRESLRITTNSDCQRPCILDGSRLSRCNLNPSALKQIVHAILLAASVVSPTLKTPMVPGSITVTCDAMIVANICWRPADVQTLSNSPPRDSLDATARWLLLELWCNSKRRTEAFTYSVPSHTYDFKKGMVLCSKGVRNASQVARSRPWTLEQLCCIVENIKEEHFATCRNGCGVQDTLL